MHLLPTRVRLNQSIGLISKSPFSPAMYGSNKLSRRALLLFLIIYITPSRLFTSSCHNYLISSTKNTVPLSCWTFLQMDQPHNSSNIFLFSNFYGWEYEFSFKIIWNFLAISHGKRAVNGIGLQHKSLILEKCPHPYSHPKWCNAYYELAESLNMEITLAHISSDSINEKCAPRLPVWYNTLAVTDTMKFYCIKVRNSWQLEVAAFLRWKLQSWKHFEGERNWWCWTKFKSEWHSFRNSQWCSRSWPSNTWKYHYKH